MPNDHGYFTDREVAALTGLQVTAKLEFAYGSERRFHRISKETWEEYPPERTLDRIDP